VSCTESGGFLRQTSLNSFSESATIKKSCHRVQSELPELSLEDVLEELEDELEDEDVSLEAFESLEGFLLSFPA